MRILHIVKVGALANGITSVVSALSKAQEGAGAQVEVININSHAPDNLGFRKSTSSLEFVRILKEFKPNIVVFHSMFYPELKNYSKILRAHTIPYIIQPHGAFSKENYAKNKLKKWVFRKLFLNRFITGAQGWVFLNEKERQNFVLRAPNIKELVIPNGCYRHSYDKNNVNKSITFLFLSRIVLYHKGLDNLIEGIKLYLQSAPKEASPTVEFIICGPGTGEDLKRFKSLLPHYDNRVKYVGAAYGEEKDKLFANANIFMLTSRFEGFPVSILEALSFGCPCMISEATNVAEIINRYNCGWVLDDITPSTIAETIRTAIRDYLANKQKLVDNAILASEEYLWDRIAQRSIDLYTSVIK